MRKACSTQSLYSDGVSSPIMSVRPRISVLRFRQLSTHRLYDRREHACNLDLTPLGQERAEAPLRVGELTPRPLRLAVAGAASTRPRAAAPRPVLARVA